MTDVVSPVAAAPKGQLIVKSNYLVNAEYRLSPIEMKIIYLMSMQVKPIDEDFKIYYLRIKDFQEDLNLKTNKALYSRMEEIVERLMNRVIKIRYENGDLDQFHFVSKAMHKNRKGLIGLRFEPDLKPHLLNLKERFTSFYDYNVLSLRSQFSMRIYELLKQYERIGRRTLKVEKLKQILKLEDKYKSYNRFKVKVIIKAQTDLKENCDIEFDFREIKAGRRVDEIEFLIKKKRDAIAYLPKNGAEPTAIVKAKLAEMGLTQTQIAKFVDEEQKDPAYLFSLIEETQFRYAAGKVKNPAAYLVKLIDTGAQTRSKFEAGQSKKQAKEKQQQQLSKQQEKEEQTRILDLQKKFHAFVERKQQELFEAAKEEDWLQFEDEYRNAPYVSGKIFKNGVLLRKEKETLYWFKYFLYPNTDDKFLEWVVGQGLRLKKAPNKESRFSIVAEQGTLFQ